MRNLQAATATSNLPDTRVLDRLNTGETVCIAASTSIAAAILCAWLVPAVASALPSNWALMKVNTALATLLCAAALTLWKHGPRMTLARRICASAAVFLASAALFEHLSRRSSGLSTLLAADSGSSMPGLMSIQSAACFLLLGLILSIERSRKGLLGHVLDFLNVVLVMLVLVLVAGYIFRATNLIGQSSDIRTSPQTLVSVALLTFGGTSRRACYGVFSVLVGIGIGGHFARITLPISVILSYLFIIAGANLLASGVLTLPYAAAVTASGLAVVLIALTVLLAGKINVLDSRLRDLSLSDELTGLHNRRGFYLLGEQVFRGARRAARPVTVLFFDVDGLKKVNDALGHNVGSQLLRDVAALLRATFRDSDVVGRIGGDEFAVIAHGSKSGLATALRRLDEAIETANTTGNKPYQIGVSVGKAATEWQSEESLEDLLDRADAAMYREKRGQLRQAGKDPAGVGDELPPELIDVDEEPQQHADVLVTAQRPPAEPPDEILGHAG